MPDDTGDNRNADGTFKSGVSGNPEGRPPNRQSIPDLLRKIGSEEGSVDGLSKLEVVLRKGSGLLLMGNGGPCSS